MKILPSEFTSDRVPLGEVSDGLKDTSTEGGFVPSALFLSPLEFSLVGSTFGVTKKTGPGVLAYDSKSGKR